MSIAIHTFVLGPIQNNTYLVVDEESHQAAIIDPAAPSKHISDLITEQNLKLAYIFITHAHFDHIMGVKWARSLSQEHIPVAMHSLDMDLWKEGGGARDFGFEFDAGEVPDLIVEDQQIIPLGSTDFKVLHTPGHSFGHVAYYSSADSVAFCGDLIFLHGIGRTDLDTGSESALNKSIREKIFTLPGETVLYPGHGDRTSVKEEKKNNPFLFLIEQNNTN